MAATTHSNLFCCAQSKTEDFETDDGWETFDEDDEPEYDEEEFHKFQAEREREIQEQLDRGILPPGYPYYGNVPPGAQPFQMPPPGHPGLYHYVYALTFIIVHDIFTIS